MGRLKKKIPVSAKPESVTVRNRTHDKNDSSVSTVSYNSVSSSPENALTTESGIQMLQKVAGNRAVHRLIQTKLQMSSPDDIHEKEAEHTADAVMKMAQPDEKVLKKSDEDTISPVRISCKENPSTHVVDSNTAAAIDSTNGGGQRLSPTTAAWMGERIGANFDNVRIHSDSQAAVLSNDLGAQAFTVGEDIYFGAGKYDTGSGEGKKLLAHELTHVVQQHGSEKSGSGIDRKLQLQPEQVETAHKNPLPENLNLDLRENASPMLAGALGSTEISGFAMASPDIPKSGVHSLRETAKNISFFLKKYPLSTVTVAGHTDRVGTEKNNIALGNARAVSVSAFLIANGVSASVITSISKGESEPSVPTKDEKPEPKNRRVVVQFHIDTRTVPSMVPPLALVPPPTPVKPDISLPPNLSLPPDYYKPPKKDKWQEMEENQKKIDEYDRKHPKKQHSVQDIVIDSIMDTTVKPILKALKLSPELRKFAEGAIRDGLGTLTEKGCDAAIDSLTTGDKEKEALKSACKAALKEKRLLQ